VKVRTKLSPFGFHLGYSRAVTRNFRRLNANPDANQTRTISGLRQVVLAVWASQVGLTLIAAIIARFVLEPRAPLGLTQGFALVSLVLYLGVNAFVTLEVSRSKSFAAVFQGCILLGAISTVPGVLACVLIALEGVRAGALLLGFSSLILLASSLTRVAGFVAQIKPIKADPEDQDFAGFGSSSEFDRPDWAAQYGSSQPSGQPSSGQPSSGQPRRDPAEADQNH
jgi:hypothetical protein